METKGFLFEVIINVLVYLALFDSFKYLCYGATAIIIVLMI